MRKADLTAAQWRLFSLIGIVAGPLIFLAWIYPLLPNTAIGWLACVATGAALGFWTVMNVLLLTWLQRQTRFRILYSGLGVIVAISLGATIFWVALNGQAFIQSNFSYFGR